MDLKYSSEDVKKYVLDKSDRTSVLRKYDTLSEIAKKTLNNVYRALYRYPLRDPEVLYILEESIKELNSDTFKRIYEINFEVEIKELTRENAILLEEILKLKKELQKGMTIANIAKYLGVSTYKVWSLKNKS